MRKLLRLIERLAHRAALVLSIVAIAWIVTINPTVNETIDADMFKRWRADPKYRPDNLIEWAHRKNVDRARLQTSVEAGDPQVSVPDQ
jgi:hypothetical protein